MPDATETGRAPPGRDLKLDVAAEPGAIRVAIRHAVEALAEFRQAGNGLDHLELVLAEILNNIAEHAYRGIADGRIAVELGRSGSAIRVTIRDRGLPMPDELLPPAHLPDSDCRRRDLPEGGWGWFIVRSLADDLSYCRDGNANVLKFKVNLRQPNL